VLGSLDRETLQRWNTCFLPPEGPGHTAPASQPLAGRTIAIARDAAFAFIYPSNLEVLQALGATLTFFSPLADDPLPACDAVWLPGGYPELHAEQLSACRRLPETLRESLLVVTAVGDEAQKRAQRVIVSDEFVEAGAHAIPLSFLPL